MTEHPRLAPPLEPEPPAVPPSSPDEETARRRRTPIIIAAIVGLLVLAAGVTALGVRSGSDPNRDGTPAPAGARTSADPAQRAKERLEAATVAARRWYASHYPDRSVMGIGVEQIEGDGPGQMADVAIGASVNAGAKDYASVQVYWDRVHLSGEDTTWTVLGHDEILAPTAPDSDSLGTAAPGASQAATKVVGAFFGYDTSRLGPDLERMRALLHPDGERALRPYLTSLRRYAKKHRGLTTTVQPVTVGFTELHGDIARAVVLFRVTGRKHWVTFQPERWVVQLSLRTDHGVWKAVDMTTVSGPDRG